MQLSWLQYQKGNKAKYYLVLMLLDLEDKYVALMTKYINDADIAKIRKNMALLDGYNITDKIKWFREHISTYNKAYREFKKKQTKVDGMFPLKAV